VSKIDFYLLDNPDLSDAMRYTCRLTNKGYRLGKRVFIRVEDMQQARQLDELLWTFNDQSFIPHVVQDGSPDDAPDTREPVLIGIIEPRAGDMDLLINLATTLPANYAGYEMVKEVVRKDENCLAAARQRWRQYQDSDNQLDKHDIGN
jgi:DNA polymerase-3 subunit chi